MPLDPPPALDLNADLGESWGPVRRGDDEAMLEVVTTANIACGGHAGDPTTMRAATAGAARRGIAITAHVSYPDLEGFGRRFQDIGPAELVDQIVVQAGGLIAMATAEGTRVRGVKPHGALYNALAHHEAQAAAVVEAMAQLGGDLTLVAAPGALVAERARAAGIPVVAEGFADRAYLPDGSLMPRDRDGAVLTDPEAVARQAVALATRQQVFAAGGAWIDLPCRTLCLHGDTPGAVDLARRVRTELEAAGVRLAAAI